MRFELFVAMRYLRAARKGAVGGDPQGGDVAQRPGTFVIAPDGTVAFVHYNKDSADNPDTEELLRTVQRLAPASNG